jgi:hypothetical protein
MLERRRYAMVVLTPVHIGTGVSIGPEEYFLDGDWFVRFSTAHVFGLMSDGERLRYEQLMNGSDFQAGIRLVREVAKRHQTECARYRVPVGEACRARLEVLSAQRDNAVQTMPHAGDPDKVVVPGTAIKGAIRTALLSELLQRKPDLVARTERQVWSSPGQRLFVNSRDLESEVIGAPKNRMEADPFRFLTVRDASISASKMRVDQFQMVGRDGEPKGGTGAGGGILIYGERLISLADRLGVKQAAVGVVDIGLDEGRQRDAGVDRVLQGATKLRWTDVEEMTRAFYSRRLAEEMDRFAPLYEWLKPDQLKLAMENGLLLRIGRHSHFEAASLDGVRRGWQIMPRPGKAIAMGSTRTVCRLQDGSKSAAMGWVWLCPQ